MSSISVNLSSIASIGKSTGGNDAGNGSTIEGLKKKLVSLQKDLRDASAQQSKEGMAKAKLIQMQIQVIQARLEQLIQQQAQQAAEAAKGDKHGSSSGVTVKHAAEVSGQAVGSNVDTFA